MTVLQFSALICLFIILTKNTQTTFKKQSLGVYLTYLIFIILSLSLLNETINTAVFLFINHWSNILLHRLLILHITEFGNATIAITLTLIFLNKFPQYSKQVLLLAFLLALTVDYTKGYFDTPRPILVLDNAKFFILDKIATKESFPSGHSATVFALLTLVWLHTKNFIFKNTLLIITVLVGLSRIAVGVHWPVDVVFGALLGYLITLLVNKLLPISNKINYINRLIIIFLSIMVIISVLLLDGIFEEFINAPSVYIVRQFMAIIALLTIIYQLFQMRHIPTFIMTKITQDKPPTHWRFIKFGIVGGSGFLVDSGLYLLLSISGMPHLHARALSYWISATTNWFLNRIFTFKDAEKTPKVTQWFKYLLMAVGSFVLNWGTYYLLTQHVLFFDKYKIIAFVAGVAMGTLFNFSIAHWVIFKPTVKTRSTQ